jgi:hypothetical protein
MACGFVQAVGHRGFAPAGHVPNMPKPQPKPSRAEPSRRIVQFDALCREIAHPAFASRRPHLL